MHLLKITLGSVELNKEPRGHIAHLAHMSHECSNVLRSITALLPTASLVLYVVDKDSSSLYVWTTSYVALT